MLINFSILFTITLLSTYSPTSFAATKAELKDCSRMCSANCKSVLKKFRKLIDDASSTCGNSGGGGGGHSPGNGVIEIFRSDTCDSSPNAVITNNTNCRQLSSSGSDAWAVKQAGVCINIPDRSLQQACREFKGIKLNQVVTIHRSDSCDGKLKAVVTPKVDCNRFSSSGSDGWAVKFGNRCINIPDRSIKQTCEDFKGVRFRRVTSIYRSDTCEKNLKAVVTQKTNCNQFASSGSDGWAIKVSNRCINIPDRSVQKTCSAFKGVAHRRIKTIYRSDSCEKNLNAVITPNTDCSQFSSGGSDAWGVKIDGQCTNIPDRSIRSACQEFKDL